MTLPRHIDPRKLAQQGINLDGSFALSELKRLTPLLVSESGEGQAKLEFGIDDQGIRNLKGQIELQVKMVCQRCLEPVSVEVKATLSLGMVWSDEDAGNLPKVLDPWVVHEGQSDLYEVMEDELLLSLPIVVYHDYECVQESLFTSEHDSESEGKEEASPKKANPFAVLETLKGTLQGTLKDTVKDTSKESPTENSKNND
jgi:uncharacterized protein